MKYLMACDVRAFAIIIILMVATYHSGTCQDSRREINMSDWRNHHARKIYHGHKSIGIKNQTPNFANKIAKCLLENNQPNLVL